MLRAFQNTRLGDDVRAGVAPAGGAFEHAVLERVASGNHRLQAGSGTPVDLLRKVPSATVLPTSAYSLQLVEAPNVPKEEMGEAVRWKIQHLIEFPIEEAVIETFELPPPANPGAKSMIYAVVARRSEIEAHIDAVRAANLKIDVIDIPELCMRNIAVRLPQDAHGVAFLHFSDEFGYLTITRGGVLYMIRRIEMQREALAQRLQEVALEIQRSLDYYESTYDCRPVDELVLSPGGEAESIAPSLAQNLGIAVSQLDLASLFTLEPELSPQAQRNCLMAIGAALREDRGVAGAAA